MDTSDSQRPPASDPVAVDPEAAKAAEQPQAAPRVNADVLEPEHILLPSEADSIERAHFEMLERETTQPVRPYAFETTAPESFPPEPQTGVPDRYPEIETARPMAFEPAPFAVPPPTDRPAPVVPQSAALPAYVEPEPTAPPDPPPSFYVDPPQHDLRSEPVAPQSPSFPTHVEPEPTAPAAPLEEPAPAPGNAAPPTLYVDLPQQHDFRREPAFDSPAAPSLSVDADIAAAIAAPPRRDWRDLLRRAAAVAFLVFAGWFAAVMMLILAYRFIDPPFSMLMAQRFLTGTAIDKQWVPIERISPNLSRAVIVAEDGRFCQHWGIDFIEAANAIRRSSTGYPRGASTITMQVAKNLFLVPAKSYLRKMVEIPLTFAIELVWPKQRILEIYLNIVEWGPGIFGAEAASRSHFGRSASGLSARQAAQLAAVLPNPIVRDAGAPGPRTSHKASIIQARAARTREASACVDIRR